MKTPINKISFLTGALLCQASTSHAATFTIPTVATYDEQTTQTNSVDFYVTTETTTATATGGASSTLDGYKTAFATAYASDFGGVADFDGDGVTASATDTTAFTYGTNGTKTLNTAFAFRTASFSTSVEISGTKEAIFRTPGGGDTGSGTINFTSITNGLLNEQVVRFGLTFLERDSTSGTISGIATFTNGTTDTASATLSRALTNALNDSQDTFFGFTAPSGQWIKSVAFTSAGNFTMDDLAFATAVVPEPSSSALVGFAALGLIARRRR